MSNRSLTRQELFRNSELLVRRVVTGSRLCVVTFTPYGPYRDLDRWGFAEDFLMRRRIEGIHVICSENNWYHEPGIFEAVARIRECAADYKRVITYGSSMGGYAAIRFAGLTGAADAIAFSPQLSINQAVCPFENRWPEDAARITFLPEVDRAPKLSGEVYAFYDPCDDYDRRHAEICAAEYRTRLIPLPRSGHPATYFLQDRGPLEPAVLDILFGRFDPSLIFVGR